MDEELRQLLKEAHIALSQGADIKRIDQRVAELTGGQINSYKELARVAFTETKEAKKDAALARSQERGDVGEVLRTAEQGATFGLGDEVNAAVRALGPKGLLGMALGAVGGPAQAAAREVSRPGFEEKFEEALGEEREVVEDFREAHPVASGIAEVSGGLLPALVPGLGAGAAGARAGGAVAGRAGAIAGRSVGLIGAGAAEGAAYGAGTAEEGERVAGAKRGAAVGGLLAPILGQALPAVVGGVVRAIPQTLKLRANQALGKALRKRSGIGRTLDDAFEAAEAEVQRVQREFYQDFDRKFTSVTDEGVRDALKAPELKTIVRSTSREVAEGKRAPSFKELQVIRRKARKRSGVAPEAGDAGNVLDEEMRRAIPGLAEADQAYAQAQGVIESLQMGKKFVTNSHSATDVKRTLDALSAPEQDAFREGMLQELARKIETRESYGLGFGDPETVKLMFGGAPEIQSSPLAPSIVS